MLQSSANCKKKSTISFILTQAMLRILLSSSSQFSYVCTVYITVFNVYNHQACIYLIKIQNKNITSLWPNNLHLYVIQFTFPTFQIPVNAFKFLVSFQIGKFPKCCRWSSHGNFLELCSPFATLVWKPFFMLLFLETVHWFHPLGGIMHVIKGSKWLLIWQYIDRTLTTDSSNRSHSKSALVSR